MAARNVEVDRACSQFRVFAREYLHSVGMEPKTCRSHTLAWHDGEGWRTVALGIYGRADVYRLHLDHYAGFHSHSHEIFHPYRQKLEVSLLLDQARPAFLWAIRQDARYEADLSKIEPPPFADPYLATLGCGVAWSYLWTVEAENAHNAARGVASRSVEP